MNSLLVVDDEPGVRSIISRWGRSHGYIVMEADSAEAALEQMRQRPAAIALCDLNMPGRDGRWLTHQLRERFPETVIVITTGMDERQATAELPEGALGCLIKPFTLVELAGILEKALDRQFEQASARTSSAT
jgi:CheY-like chemotaxis protein